MVPSTDAPFAQVDEAKSSGIATHPVTKTMQILSDEPQDIATSSGIVLELLTPGSVGILTLIMIPLLSVIFS